MSGNDIMAPAAARLDQVAKHLAGGVTRERVHATAFRPKLPTNLQANHTPMNPLTFLLKAAQINPNRTGLTHPSKGLSWTFSQWATRVSHLAYALKSRGVKPGDRVLVLGPNAPWVADALQAIPAVQAIIVAINTRQTAPEAAWLIEHSGSTFILADDEYKHLLEGTKVPMVVCHDTGRSDDGYEKFLEEGAAYDRAHGGLGWEGHEFQADEDATLAISYTSGTTSRPKGVETSYKGTYLAAIAAGVESRLDSDSRWLFILPMFHALGWCYPYACTMAMCLQECSRGVGDYTEIWKGFLERGITHYAGAPTVQLSIVSHPLAKKLDRKVRTTVAGAAPTKTLIVALEKIGIDVQHVYGLTETYGPMTRSYFTDANDSEYFVMKTRQGHSFLTADDIRVIRLIPEDEEHLVPPGELQETRFDGSEVGEIVMRGNIVMKGYYNNPEATKKAFINGWFRTGDLGVRYPDGTFDIRDRSKDLIISGGENISSLACESVLSEHPDVHELAVVARPHEKWGERPHAFVVLKEGGAKWAEKASEFEKDLKAFARGKMPPFAIPEWVEVVPELEKTSTGKIQKKALRDRVKAALAGIDRSKDVA